jgi:hypothetical protein
MKWVNAASFRVASRSIDNNTSAPHCVLENKQVHGRMQQHPETPERFDVCLTMHH